MAKKSTVQKNLKRQRTVKKYAEKRNNLLGIAKDPNAKSDARMEARRELAKLPVNANPNRIVNRCEATGRPRGYIRFFGCLLYTSDAADE